jgi:hypothetical protein
MRVGYNHIKTKYKSSDYFHQVIVPAYIQPQEGYFKDSFEILKLRFGVFNITVHSKTFLSVL